MNFIHSNKSGITFPDIPASFFFHPNMMTSDNLNRTKSHVLSVCGNSLGPQDERQQQRHHNGVFMLSATLIISAFY